MNTDKRAAARGAADRRGGDRRQADVPPTGKDRRTGERRSNRDRRVSES